MMRATVSDLPFPSLELRRTVGPTDDASYDNPTGALVFPDLPLDAYDSVFDWGCGCGRLARKLIQQRPQPRKYVGVDLNGRSIRWCVQSLAPHAPQFEFHHQDIYNKGLNPDATAEVMPFPVEDGSVSLLIAWSVFTHVLEANVQFYLEEVARVLGPDGIALTTWMLFDKGEFPMMREFQNSLYINLNDPTNAVIYDKAWLRDAARRAGLVLWRIHSPGIRGAARRVYMRRADSGSGEAEFPPETPLAAETQ